MSLEIRLPHLPVDDAVLMKMQNALDYLFKQSFCSGFAEILFSLDNGGELVSIYEFHDRVHC